MTASVGAQGSSTTTPPATGGTTPTTPTSSGQASGSVTINVAGSPQLTITVPTTPLSAGVPAAFTFVVTPATTNASPIRSVTVNWGDGGPIQDLGAITGSNQVFHTYGSTGSFTITATVTDTLRDVGDRLYTGRREPAATAGRDIDRANHDTDGWNGHGVHRLRHACRE